MRSRLESCGASNKPTIPTKKWLLTKCLKTTSQVSISTRIRPNSAPRFSVRHSVPDGLKMYTDLISGDVVRNLL